MIDALYEAMFGGIRLWASRISTVNGRKLVVHSPSSGDDHPLQDRGLEVRTASCTLQFHEMDGEPMTGRERFDRFCEIVELGEPQMFTHPLRGSYLARVGRFDHDLDEDSNLTAEVEFVPEDRIPAVTVALAGTSAAAGEDAVAGAGAAANEELEQLGISTPVTAEATAAVEAWQDPDTSARRVFVDVAQLTEKINSEIERLELASSLSHWQAYRAMLLLADALVAAGRASTSDVARIMTVKTARPIALISLLASVYGAREAHPRRPQAMALNDIPTPAWIEAGTELRLPQLGTQPRRG